MEGNVSDMELENRKDVKIVYMANNWLITAIAIIVWIFLSFLNIYAIVQLGISHGDVS